MPLHARAKFVVAGGAFALDTRCCDVDNWPGRKTSDILGKPTFAAPSASEDQNESPPARVL